MKPILDVIKFSLFRLFPKPVQINPKADNIRAKSNNGYVHCRGSSLLFASRVPRYSILAVLNRNVSSGLGTFLISTTPESSNQNRHGESPTPQSFTVIAVWRVRRFSSRPQHKSLVVRTSRRPGYNSLIITSLTLCTSV